MTGFRGFRLARIVPALLLIAFLAGSAHAALRVYPDGYRMKVGDGAGWESPELDDGDWQPTSIYEVPGVESIVWLRVDVELSPEIANQRPLGLVFAGMSSNEIFWDGERIGRGGVVGATPEAEEPGPISVLFPVPDRLATPGRHLIAVRLSAWHRHFEPSTPLWGLWIGEYSSLIRSGVSQARIAVIGLSGLMMVAIFALLMYLLDHRERAYLFLALMCVAGAGLLVAESWRPLFGYTYNWHLLRLVIVTALAWLLDVLLLVFLARRFPLPGAKWFVAAGVVMVTVPILAYRSWDPKVMIGFMLVFPLALLWTLAAAQNRMRGAVLVSAGLVVCIALFFWQPGAFVEKNLYLGLNVLLVCLLVSHAMQVRRVRLERQEALLKSARLELELLKKHLQPHFLMNTLTAMAEWVEEEPATASKMIQSLSEEFRLLSDISDRSLIRMEEELRLCRSHLEIMSCRKGRQYRMSVDGVDPEARIPPAVIHTLVENAITHDHDPGQDVEFHLSATPDGDHVLYRFDAPLGDKPKGATTVEGTGLKYIRARLQESFGDRWRLTSGSAGSSWRTEIAVPAEA